MRLTPALLGVREELAKVLIECAHPGELERYWDRRNRETWLRMAGDQLSDGQPLALAVERLRRESFESGASPALGVLLSELQEALPGQYQDGLARAVVLLSGEMGQHYGAVFEAGRRIGRSESATDGADDTGG